MPAKYKHFSQTNLLKHDKLKTIMIYDFGGASLPTVIDFERTEIHIIKT